MNSPSPTTLALVVVDKRIIAEGVCTVLLASPSGGRLPDWTPGSHIDLVLPTGQVRQYSLCGDRRDPSTYRVGVLREPGGRGGSAYVHDTLGVGDLVGVGGPRNNFPMVPAARYVFVAGGIGITPLLPMVAQAEQLGAEWTLHYGGRRRASMAFLDELSGFGDRVDVVPEDEHGLLDLPAVVGAPSRDTTLYCCGPGPLLDAVAAACAGWRRHALHTERFVAERRGAPVRNTSFVVELARTGGEVVVNTGTSVLAAVRGAGAEVLSSCSQGTCGTCETAVLSGVPEHRDSLLTDAERTTGDTMFVCVSRSCSDRLVLDL